MISRNSTTFLRKQDKNYLNKMIESHNLIVNNSEKFFGEVNIEYRYSSWPQEQCKLSIPHLSLYIPNVVLYFIEY